MRKQYSATYKAEIVKDLLKEEKTLGQTAHSTDNKIGWIKHRALL